MNDAGIAIPNLLYTYADLIDAADFAGAARLFRYGAVVAGSRRVVDEDAIIALWRDWVRLYDGSPRTRHVITNPIITLAEDGESATCRSQWIVLQAVDGFPLQVVATGRHHDRFRRIDGEWQFVERDFAGVDLTGDVSAHLVRPLEENG